MPALRIMGWARAAFALLRARIALAGLLCCAMLTSAEAFYETPGWRADDHLAAFSVFRRFCETGPVAPALGAVCDEALGSLIETPFAARRFFEQRFEPRTLPETGLLTAYYEPEVEASRTQSAAFPAPLYRLPPGGPPYPDRPAVMAGALAGRELELVFLKDPVDAFFIHVQGSARLRLEDGTVMRVGFAGKSGHPYTSIGRVLVERGALTLEEATMTGIRAWLAANPDERDAVLAENRSFIFFREIEGLDAGLGPIGAAGRPLTPGRSIAVDPEVVGYGFPVFLETGGAFPGSQTALQRLTLAEDTGSAIRGPARADLFLGSGAAAGGLAGDVRLPLRMTVLYPRAGVQP